MTNFDKNAKLRSCLELGGIKHLLMHNGNASNWGAIVNENVLPLFRPCPWFNREREQQSMNLFNQRSYIKENT